MAQWNVFRESNALKITPTEQRLIAKLHSKHLNINIICLAIVAPRIPKWRGFKQFV